MRWARGISSAARLHVSSSVAQDTTRPGSARPAARRRARVGAREFFRLTRWRPKILTMGDCGAFTYAERDTPPWRVDELVDFYENVRFDYGLSLDHVILAYDESRSEGLWRHRQAMTL